MVYAYNMSLLSEILSSKIRAEIFRLLHGVNSAELHMREIERRSGCAIGTVQSELKKLLRLDLVIKRKDGNRLYYRANRDHPLYPDIHALVVKSNGLVDILRQALDRKKGIELAFVFGSFARHDEKAASDIDLLIIGRIGLRELSPILADVTEQVSREINPYIMTRSEFVKRKQTKEHFVVQLLDSPKMFIIGNENGLEAMG